METLISIVNKRDEQIQKIKHETNTAISKFLVDLNGRNIHTEIGWLYIQVALTDNNIVFTLIPDNNSQIKLIGTISITPIIENKLHNSVINFKQINDSGIIADPSLWLQLRKNIINSINDIIGFSQLDVND